MTLLEICQPLVDYVVECRRSVLAGAKLNQQEFYNEVTRKINTMREETANSPELAAEVEKILLPMVFFVDFIIKEGPFSFKASWQELGKSMYNELSGDEKFFDIMDKELNDPSSAATERLKVMFQLVIAGFSGCYLGRAQELERKLRICALRVGVDVQDDQIAQIDHQCDSFTSELILFHSPYKKCKWVLLGAAVILVAAFIFNRVAFLQATSELRDVLVECANLGVDDALKKTSFELPSVIEDGSSDAEITKSSDKDRQPLNSKEQVTEEVGNDTAK